MNEFLKTCLVVCPMLFLAGFVDSVAGGGGLISLPSYLFVGIPIHIAAGTNKVVNGIGTATAAARCIRSGKVNLSAAIWSAGGALVGAAIGARLALWFSDRLLQTCVLVALPVVAVILVVKKDFGREAEGTRRWTSGQERSLSVLIGLIIGIYDGMIGPGTGTFMIMAFTLVLGMDLLTASGCAKVANLASNIASAIVWIIGGKVMWKLVLPATICCVLGNLCGSRYAIRGGSEKVRSMIFVVLGLLFVKMAYELLT
ncbi:MAG: sulfite exporter TauE/SafE family protein [Oscillibacter sp.]|jgi:uncharacterized membrane protein YfcA|nr:sulfite exporter TauE/SafE family protein [Oscillibacter sp.]